MGNYSSSVASVTSQNTLEAPEVMLLRSSPGLTESIKLIISKREGVKEAFYILDLDAVTSLYNKWTTNLPLIQPFYAVKCNPHKSLLGALAALGSNFDCASKTEIESILLLGVSPNRIIYANPCKSESHIKFAASVGVNLTTFDSIEELNKIHKWHPKCDLLIRIKAPDDTKAKRPLGSKYGALPVEVAPLLQAAKALRLRVIGVSFHAGSATTDGGAFVEAIAEAKTVFNIAAQLGMPTMHVPDIGGGFIANSQFDEVATIVKSAIEDYFPNKPGLNVISEPGRLFAEKAFTLATKIIGKRIRGGLREYWINDGTYGSFNCILRETLSEPIKCMPLSSKGLMTYKSTVFGPTCDSLDTVLSDYELPELEVNDWLFFPNMGGYTSTSGSSFNGFETAAIATYLVTSN